MVHHSYQVMVLNSNSMSQLSGDVLEE